MGLVHLWVFCWIFSLDDEKVLMKLRSLLDKQPILSCWLVTRRCVGITRRRSPFCFVAASLGLLDFLLLVVQTFFCLLFLFETTELWFQSATLRLAVVIQSGRRCIPHNNNNIPARPAVGSDKANYYLLKDTQSDPVSPWHHFFVIAATTTDPMYYNYIIWHRRHGSSVSTLFSFN